MDKKQVVLVSGMSGAGKSTAGRILEDMGYHCIDNLPVGFIRSFVTYLETTADPRYSYTALSTSAQDFPEFLKQLNGEDIHVQVLFLDASDSVLLHRYKNTRRNHPLLRSNSANTLEEAIAVERQMFQNLANDKFTIIDTTFIEEKELKQRMESYFSPNKGPSFAISFLSFGYKNGVPMDADLMLDVRFLPNPYWIPELRNLTGNDPEVVKWIMEKAETQELIMRLTEFTDYALKEYVKEGKNHFTIAIGCTGGQHRSVAITNYLYNHYRNQYHCYCLHRDVCKEERK